MLPSEQIEELLLVFDTRRNQILRLTGISPQVVDEILKNEVHISPETYRRLDAPFPELGRSWTTSDMTRRQDKPGCE